jgi:Xaa-Pro aminopeptidase
MMKKRYPLHNYRRSARIIKDLRAIKTALEVEVMQKAMDITDRTFRRLLQFIKPGVMEYEIEAEIYHSSYLKGLPVRLMGPSLPAVTGPDIALCGK